MNARTNQNNAVPQIVKQNVRRGVHERMSAELNSLLDDDSDVDSEANELVATDLEKGYHIAAVDEKNSIYFEDWLPRHASDPAFKVGLLLFAVHKSC